MPFGLNDKTLETLQNVFRRFPVVDQVLVYGSRAKGTYKNGSDIDLTLVGKKLDQRQCSDIAEALDELLLPYMIDLSVYHLLDNQDLRDHIDRVGKVLYMREVHQ